MSEKQDTDRSVRRNAIVHIAREVFLQEGFAATSMSRIAVAAGGSKATLYHYFSSKQVLFFAVIRAESERSLAHLFDGAEPGPDFATDLKGLCVRFMELLLSDDLIALFRLITAESGRFPEIGQVAYDGAFARGLERTAALIADAMARGDLRTDDPHRAAEMLLNLAMGNMHLRRLWGVCRNVTPAEISEMAEQISETFLALYRTTKEIPAC